MAQPLFILPLVGQAGEKGGVGRAGFISATGNPGGRWDRQRKSAVYIGGLSYPRGIPGIRGFRRLNFERYLMSPGKATETRHQDPGGP